MSLRHIAALRAAYASRARHHETATRTIVVGLAAVGMVVAFAACREQDPTAPMRAPRAAHLDVEPTPTVEVYVNGAPQSWQLFMGNRAVASLASGRKVIIVHTDAGDGGNGAAFWQARERGALASVDAALGASGAWTCGAQPTNSHGIQRCARANAVVYFMRMPDGNSIDGQGYGFGSMSRLRDLAAPTTTIDGSATYVSWADFVATLQAVVLAETVNASGSAIEVHSPDYDRTMNAGDHPDNFATADAARAAAQSMGWTFAWYTDFQTINMPVNVSGGSLTTKQAVWTAYDNAMVAAGFNSGATDASVQAWLQRTYFRVASTTPGAPSNLTAHASTKSRIDLQWTDNATNEAGFNIERAPNNAGVPGAFAAVGTVGANVAAFADLSASPTTTYWYRVRAFSDGAVSAYTSPVSATTPATTTLPYRTDVYIMAHSDDWQLFAGDRAVSSFQQAADLVFVYLTAADGGNSDPAYWQARERAAMASIDWLTGPGAWSCAPRNANAHPIQRCFKAGTVMYFMRMPDGNNLDGTGYGRGSMEQLRDNGTVTSAVDGSTSYSTWANFTNTVGAVVDLEATNQNAPWTQVHTQENSRTLDPGDHPDHNTTGDAVKAVSGRSGNAWTISWYVGYDTQNRPANLGDAQHAQKLNEFSAYDATMVTAGFPSNAGIPEYQAWMYRTYARTTFPQSPTLQAPSALAVKPVSASELDLSWTDNSPDEDQFYIERAPDRNGASGTYVVIDSVTRNVTTYANTGLTSGGRYWYRVRGLNSTGYSPYSNEATMVTSTGVPAAPTGLATTPLTSTSIALDWTDVATNETGYEIEQAPDVSGAPGSFVSVASILGNSITWTATKLAPSTTYWFRIRASTETDSSAYSNITSGTTFPPPPAAPSNFVLTPVSGAEVDLTWTDNATNETGFTIQRAPDNAGAAGTYATIASPGADATSYSNTGLAANVAYWYRIRARNAGGSSAWVVATATTLATPPVAPSALLASATTAATTAKLTWTDNSIDETGFRIEVAPDIGGTAGTYAEIGTVAANVKTYTPTALAGATKYWFRVRAYGTYGNSGYTNESSMTTPLPTNLSGNASGTTANLAWTAGVGAKVDVYRDGVKIKTGIANTGASSDTGRTVGTSSVYQVCNAGFSDAANCSNAVTITF